MSRVDRNERILPSDRLDSEREPPEPKSFSPTQSPETSPPRITFRGNGSDLTALGAFASGILVLLTCLTCGQILYCLPIVPIILGIIGLAMAKASADEDRTRLWSWLGIGGGSIVIVLTALAIVSYFILIGFIVAVSNNH